MIRQMNRKWCLYLNMSTSCRRVRADKKLQNRLLQKSGPRQAGKKKHLPMNMVLPLKQLRYPFSTNACSPLKLGVLNSGKSDQGNQKPVSSLSQT